MSSRNLSVAQILSDLETQIAHFEDQAASHGRQEAFHRAEQTRCEEEAARLRERYEAFKAASEAAGEVVQRPMPAALHEKTPEAADDGSTKSTATLISWVVEWMPMGESFGPTAVTEQIGARCAKWLRRPVNVRSVSVGLSRMAAEGRIKLVRGGRAHHEALYERVS